MMRPETFGRLMVLLVLGLAPVYTSALERQNLQLQSSEEHVQVPNATPWDDLPPDVAAREWSLTKEEWAHYRELMQGRARYYASDMPPLMVLAMYADSNQKRDHYAELLAQYERDKADRILKVQRAYDAAMNRLYPNEKIIDLDLLRAQGMLSATSSAIPGVTPNSQESRTPHFGDKLALFVAPDCAGCADKIRTLATQYAVAPLEVYFTGDSTSFKDWLIQSKLQADWLKQHGVSFAKDEGQSKQYQATPGTVFIVRDHALLEMLL